EHFLILCFVIYVSLKYKVTFNINLPNVSTGKYVSRLITDCYFHTFKWLSNAGWVVFGNFLICIADKTQFRGTIIFKYMTVWKYFHGFLSYIRQQFCPCRNKRSEERRVGKECRSKWKGNK